MEPEAVPLNQTNSPLSPEPNHLEAPQQSHLEVPRHLQVQRSGLKKSTTLKTHVLQSGKSFADVGDLDDDSIVDLDYDKNLTKIDYERMRQSLKNTHAYKVDGSSYNCKDVCYNFESGQHYICSSSEKSDNTKFGVGVVLYFKFVKHLIFYFFLFTILSIPAYIYYIASYTAAVEDTSVSYLDLLTATTVGSVGISSTSCGIAKFPDDASSDEQKQIYFECTMGKIASIDNMVFGLVEAGTTCAFIDDADLETSCNVIEGEKMKNVFGDCVGETSCTITINRNIFLEPSDYEKCDKFYQTRNIYVQMQCTTTTLSLFNNSVDVDKSTIAFVVSALDAVIIILFLFMIYTLKRAQKSASQNVLKKAYSASAYTIELKNLPQSMPAEELTAKLWTFLDNTLGEKAVAAGHRVVDVQIVLPNKLIGLSKAVGDIIHQKNTLMREFIELYAPDFPSNQIDFKGLVKVMENLKRNNHEEHKEIEKRFKKIKDLVHKKEKLLLQIQKLRTEKDIRIISAFVTFSSMPARNKILDVWSSSPLDRCARVLCKSCYSQESYFHDKVLRAKSTVDPGSILWENLGEPGSSIAARRGFSFFLTLMLWIVSGVILIVSTYYKNYLKDTYPDIDCDDKTPTSEEAAKDYMLGDYQQGLITCYCSEDMFATLYERFALANNEQLCYQYYRYEVTSTAITFVVVFIVLVINYGIQFVFQGLSIFEKHSSLNSQLATRVLKTFVAQFLNTGLLILLVNARIDDIGFWQGKFRDISSLWYENVGATLLSTMFINVFTVPTVKAVFVLFQKIQRWYDRGFKSDAKLTKKKTQTEYEELYTGPEFIIDFRYSQILTLTFVCFLYSGGMPFLYITSFAQLTITYFFDKFFLLKVCKLPKNYDERLEKVIRHTLYIIIIIHLIVTIYMFGNSETFGQEVSTASTDTGAASKITKRVEKSSDGVTAQFFDRAQMDHNLILFVLLLIIAAVFILKGLVLTLLRSTVFAIFTKEEDESRRKSKGFGKKNKVSPELHEDDLTFLHVIQSEDIANLIRLTKVTIKATQDKDLIELFKKKLVLLKQEYLIRKEEEATKGKEASNFIGFYTYDIRLSPMYKEQFAIEEQLDDEDLS